MKNIKNRFALTLALAALPLVAAAQSGGGRDLPADVHPDSLSRLPLVDRNDLDADGQRIYDKLVGDGPQPRTGPVAVSMHSPTVAEGFDLLNSYLRGGGSLLVPRDYEVAVMVAAWEFDQPYEWSAHEAGARRFGVPENVIDAIKYDRGVEGLGEKDALIITFARQLLRDHKVDSETYREIVQEFGERGMVELATIIGDYVMVGLVLTAADQHLPEDRPNTLPER